MKMKMIPLLLCLLSMARAEMYSLRECKKSQEGAEYMGKVHETAGGITCQRWDSQEPHSHGFDDPRMFPDNDWDLTANNCRNPDLESEGPWCYTTDPGTRYTFCDIPQCEVYPECKLNEAGTGYRGTLAQTSSGTDCIPWADVGYTEEENYCRNPNDDPAGPWCFTSTDEEFEYCDVPLCTPSESCKSTGDGAGYTGTRSMTVSGIPCQRWDHQSPHSHDFTEDDQFPDSTVTEAANYCRNPDTFRPEGPWCYTRDTETEWEYCDIPHCDDGDECDDGPETPVRHVLHIGLDGLHADCFLNADSGAPNMMERLAAKGTYTQDARTALETVSGPGWSYHVCGMDSEATGVTGNGWQAPWMGYSQPITPVTSDRTPVPCVFRHLKGLDENIRTASFMNWRWIYWMGNRGAAGSVDVDWSCTGLGVDGDTCDAYVVGNASDYLRNIAGSAQQSYTFLHIDILDHKGHGSGWCGDTYLDGVDTVDAWVGDLLDAIDDEEGQEWLVVLSSDHGGSGFSHGAAADSDLKIPLFMRGPGVKQNHVFDSQVSNSDIVPTVTWAMGLPASPWWTGHVMEDGWLEAGVVTRCT